MKTLISLFSRFREQILYLFFGVCTTAVNFAVYFGCTRLFRMDTVSASTLGWLLSVLFAYVTNRRWVFESKAHGVSEVAKELIAFFGGRLATGVLDIAIMYVTVDLLHFNDAVMKLLSNVIVIVLNYVISKLMVFRKK